MRLAFTKSEKKILLIAGIVLVLGLAHLNWLFVASNSQSLPGQGGSYTEGVVGTIHFINPVLASPNTLDADISSLVYSGLTKFDSSTGKVVPDLAEYTLDKTKKKYTFKIRDNALWHNGEKVTAEDVIFTYKTVLQSPEFNNPILQSTFRDVVIDKVDDTTVLFSLKEPYYFFPVATTLGLLPKHLWDGIPIHNLDQSELNTAPVGSGPYQFSKRAAAKADLTNIHLEAFAQYYGQQPKIKDVSFTVYSDENTLLRNLSSIDGVNNLSLENLEKLKSDSRFQIFPYTLPQYVALFLNTTSKELEDRRVRLALLLATNKDDLIQQFGSDMRRIDTPFLELKNASWLYQFDLQKAQGSLFDAGWKFKNPQNEPAAVFNSNGNGSTNTNGSATVSLQPRYLAAETTPTSQYRITEPNNGVSFSTTQNYFVLRGTSPTSATGLSVNGYRLQKFVPEKGSWSYVVSTQLGTLKEGKNVYNVSYVNDQGSSVFLDTLTITYSKAVTPPPVTPPKNQNANTPVIVNRNANVSSTNVNASANANLNAAVTENTNANLTVNTNRNEGQPVNKNVNAIPANILERVRYNSAGQPLVLHLVTSDMPGKFSEIATYLQNQWFQMGVYLNIEVVSPEEMLSRIQTKSYDILLYGQNLGYNLDTFPYWHSSQAGNTGFNLSNLKSFQADALLEEIRNPYLNKNIEVTNEEEVDNARQEALKKLVTIFENSIPAIFLYQPVYYYGVDTHKVKHAGVENLAVFSDRFESLVENWYIVEHQILSVPFTFDSFKNWVMQNLTW